MQWKAFLSTFHVIAYTRGSFYIGVHGGIQVFYRQMLALGYIIGTELY